MCSCLSVFRLFLCLCIRVYRMKIGDGPMYDTGTTNTQCAPVCVCDSVCKSICMFCFDAESYAIPPVLFLCAALLCFVFCLLSCVCVCARYLLFIVSILLKIYLFSLTFRFCPMIFSFFSASACFLLSFCYLNLNRLGRRCFYGVIYWPLII